MSLYIKRKKVNYDLVEQKSLFSPSSSQCSLASTPQNYPHEVKKSMERLLPEKILSNEKLELEKQLKQATQSEKSWRHKFKLMENEREEYESSVHSKYEKEKEALDLELKLLRQTYMDKVQSMSSSMLQLQKKVARLERQLAANGITEEIKDINDEKEDHMWLLNSLKEDAEFIKTAHHQAMHEYPMSSNHTLWALVQKNALDLKQELYQIQSWRTTMTHPSSEKHSQQRSSEDAFKFDDKTLSGGIKKAIFGKTHRSVKRKSAIFA